MVAKLAPPVTEFKAIITSFDFYQDIVDDTKAKPKAEFPLVPLHFDDEHHYVDTFMPLFWQEAKSQLHRAKMSEMKRNPEIARHVAFKSEGEWLRLDLQRGKEEAGQTQYNPLDLVILTQGQEPVNEHPVHFLAAVDTSSGVKMTVSTKLKEGVTRALEVAKVIATSGSWQLAKVVNMSTLIREYEALKAFPRINLRDIIINQDDSGLRRDTATEMQAAPDLQAPAGGPAEDGPVPELLHIPQRLEEWLHQTYNEPQQKAINDCRKVSGITLVQGPPGTGKTKTALGILAVLLNAKAKETKVVSYTRTCGSTELVANEDGDDKVEDEAIKALIAKREMDRVRLLRARAPWLRGGFLPWTATVEQEVPATGSSAWRKPFPKLAPSEVVSMSEVTEDAAPQKVLVCAPSNGGIDEVLRRVVREGIVGPDGMRSKPSVVRLGPNVHPGLEEYSLESIVTRRLAALSEAPNLNQREEEKARLIRDARIVCTTLSISGSRDVVGFEGGFDTVLVDEASQGVEVSMLVPLKLGCRRLIMIGDPKQLPATCFSAVALAHDYDRSLFQRLQESQHKVNLLQVQYRMHPSISYFPSKQFYDGCVRNALEQAEFEKAHHAPWSHVPCFGPVAFFDVKGEHQESNLSLVNEAEADFVIRFYAALTVLWPNEIWYQKLAVISPYAEQVKLIRSKFRALFKLGDKQPCPVDVNTVDGFQGREKDCIIVSAVRADPDRKTKSIGFLRDKRRMNVAFTRARTNLWIVGYVNVLRRNDDWWSFIKLQQESARLLRVPRPFDSFLTRYLKNYFERHPDAQLPPGGLSMLTESGDVQDDAPELEISPEELEELESKEAEEALYRRDIEEVSANSSESEGGEEEDGEEQAKANQHVDGPPAKRLKAGDDAEGGEDDLDADGSE